MSDDLEEIIAINYDVLSESTVYTYSKFLGPVVYFSNPGLNQVMGRLGKAQYTWFLPRLARKETNGILLP